MSVVTDAINVEVTDRTIAAALAYAESCLGRQLAAAYDDRAELRGEARALLRIAADLSDAQIFADPNRALDADQWTRFVEFVQRRAAGEPLAYIANRRGFHAIDVYVDERVLVPRPETELIVETVLAAAPQQPFSVLDLGTGSGAIALALAHARPDAKITAVDISAAALDVARMNADSLGLAVEWIESDWFSALPQCRYDFICCNPPYVRRDDSHLETLRYEPRVALEGGEDGLRDIRRVLTQAPAFMRTGGIILLEHGYDQGSEVAQIGLRTGLRLRRELRDAGGHERTKEFTLPE